MTDPNRVEIVGRLTKDAEIRYTPQGTPIMTFSIANERSYKKGDDWKKEVSYFDIVVWGKRAESYGAQLTKGTQVSVVGALQQRQWEKDGQKRSKVEIVAEHVLFAQYIKSGGNSGGQAATEEWVDNGSVPF